MFLNFGGTAGGGERCAVGKFEINGDDTFDRRRPFSEDDTTLSAILIASEMSCVTRIAVFPPV